MAIWEIRLGLIVPDVNVVVEPEVVRMCPREVSVHSARAVYDFSLEDPLAHLAADAPRCAKELTAANVHAIAFACTGASFYKGQAHDAAISAEISEISGVPATTTSTAVVRALQVVDAKKVALATPYDRWVNDREQVFLEGHGFTVVSNKGLGVRDGGAIAAFTLDDARRIAREAFTDEADAVFISCTNFQTYDLIDELEQDFGKPVITSNQATLWDSLRLVSWCRPIPGYGTLLTTFPG